MSLTFSLFSLSFPFFSCLLSRFRCDPDEGSDEPSIVYVYRNEAISHEASYTIHSKEAGGMSGFREFRVGIRAA